MQNTSPYYLLVFVCMGLMLLNGMKKDKQLIHYLFAVFCGSLCMVGVQKISAPSIGVYSYLIGLFTCATCNMSWLISRTLFREHKPFSMVHIAVASTIAGLIMFNQTWHYLVSVDAQIFPDSQFMWRLKQGMGEITVLLSSSILVLSFWEALRGYKGKTRTQKWQATIFASCYFLAVFNASILPKFLFSESEFQQFEPLIITSSALLIVLAMQLVMFLQKRPHPCVTESAEIEEVNSERAVQATKKIEPSENREIEPELTKGIEALIIKQQVYLQTNLKISDFAQALAVPEYKISRAIRHHFKATNFNLFINQYRVKHAQMLLLKDEASHWSILSIALESGFSSLATFNRVFKSSVGINPNEFRKQNGSLAEQKLIELAD
ncbi:helix-turn-helix domain-containing protein [Pseudoalteromonas shioyasakiensis]|uniref:helix-turn-helix domain-containing protein n=1 Tax=Pseudoalteromonas TaxID=53246 RepID=UPI001F0DAE28|nr:MULTISPECIES: helix-turn-helix domain-containing protein [Pseudoalteromonas]MCQ8882120.1 helix-turn-helix domain-containing protein [Pseudoalteromonas shioyasakiensis]